ATGVWSGLSLATGQSVTITLSGTISQSATGTITNTVHVEPPPGVTDNNPANNTATDTDTITPLTPPAPGLHCVTPRNPPTRPLAGPPIAQPNEDRNLVFQRVGGVTAPTSAVATGNGTPVPAGGLTVNLAHGTLVVFPNGSYPYPVNPNSLPPNQHPPQD